MGQAYVKLGRPQEAVPFLQRAVQLLPEHVEPHHWLGRTLIQLGRREEGRRELASVGRINSARTRQGIQGLSPQAAAVHATDSVPHP